MNDCTFPPSHPPPPTRSFPSFMLYSFIYPLSRPQIWVQTFLLVVGTLLFVFADRKYVHARPADTIVAST
eukprot:m.107895 g.107895  ORF g.107895 m.107895 type:complete len:70 (+) comp14259_c0_seq4:1365-1574(+)